MKKYIRDHLRSILKFDDPPHKLALAFALGIFIAFSPWLGFHIISCIFFAWLFRVSKFVVLTASFVNNPWTIMPMYAFCIWIGLKITGDDIAVPHIAWNELTVSTAYSILKPYLWSYLAGTLAVGSVAAIASYFLFYWAVVHTRKMERL
jgi:uncharacterized protein